MAHSAADFSERPRPIRLLITGFDRFPGVPDNPSARLVEWLENARLARGGRPVHLHAAIVPTEWQAVPAHIETLFTEHEPDIALHFGVHGRSRSFRIERRATNGAGPHADARGRRSGPRDLVAGGPPVLPVTLGVDKLVAHLSRRGIAAEPSADAGRYLCNRLLYLSLDRARRSARPTMTGFIHVPRLGRPRPLARANGHGAHGFSENDLFTGAAAAVRHCLDSYDSLGWNS